MPYYPRVAELAVANTFSLGPNTFAAGGDALVALAAKRHSSGASGNILEIQNESASALASFNAAGNLRVGSSGTGAILAGGFGAPDANIGVNVDGIRSTTSSIYGMQGEMMNNSTGATYGLSFAARGNHSSSTMAALTGIDVTARHTGAGALTNAYGARVRSTQRTGGGSQANNYGLYIDDQTVASINYAIYTNAGLVRFGDALTVENTVVTRLTNATTAAIDAVLTLDHQSSGTPANGFGARILTMLESTTTAQRDAAYDDTDWTDATDATRTSRRRTYLSRSGTMTEAFRLDNSDSSAQTNAWLLYNGTLVRVEVGAADSGGAGYRALRVAN